jgi:hypothetical protein
MPTLTRQRLEAACLVLFPLVFLVVAGTGLHPEPSGDTAADQVRTVATLAVLGWLAGSVRPGRRW